MFVRIQTTNDSAPRSLVTHGLQPKIFNESPHQPTLSSTTSNQNKVMMQEDGAIVTMIRSSSSISDAIHPRLSVAITHQIEVLSTRDESSGLSLGERERTINSEIMPNEIFIARPAKAHLTAMTTQATVDEVPVVQMCSMK